MILRTFLFFTLIFLSLFFFHFGYQAIKDIYFVSAIKIDEKKESDFDEKNKEDFNLRTSESLIKENFEAEFSAFVQKEIVLIVKQNDTFTKLIKPYVKNNRIRQQIINSINKEFDLKKLNVGQKILLYVFNLDDKNEISKIVIPLNFNTDLVVEKNNHDSNYYVNKINLPITTDLVAQKYSISNSLFNDGRKANVPLTILAEVIKLYSFDIDFQRDIRKENKLEIMYKVFYNENRRTISYGEIQYVNLTMQKNNLEYFLFKTSNGLLDYFNREGKNVKKTLMKTPVDGAKLSSSYGMRKHPILGYNKKHLGVDFAAPKNTPIYAAGNGNIEYAGRNGDYGKYIRIRHNSAYKTAYAHLNLVKKGISRGVRVNQGQIIGYVGSTGRSSGPHLHYEVIYKGKRINPMTMKLPSGKALNNKELEKFKESSMSIYSDFLFHLFE